MTCPSFSHKNSGLGIATGLHSIVTFLPSVAYTSGFNDLFLNDGLSAIKHSTI